MNTRLRAYVAVIAFRHITTACILYFDRDRYEDFKSFFIVFEIASPGQWAFLSTLVGILAIIGVLSSRKWAIRGALYGSVFISTVWATSFLFNKIDIGSTSFLLLSLYAALAIKDFIVTTAMPFRPENRIVPSVFKAQAGR